jgi:UDP-N-acetyl-2-amino-2-deoxyglucuronate dehydrogenase
MDTLGIGIIGGGRHGVRYLRHLTQDISDAALVALSRRDRLEGEALAAEYGGTFHADWRALIDNPDVHAVVTAVPPVLNADIAEAACRAGKALLIEKPLASSLDDARRIARAVRASGVHAMVAQTLRFDATVAAVRAHLHAIAPLHAVTLVQRFEPSSLPWVDRLAESGGGALLHTGVHSIDLLRVFSGHEVAEVACTTARVHTRETEDNFSMTARLDRAGFLAHIGGSRAMGARTGLMELAGEGGQIVADHICAEAWLARGSERVRLPVGEPVPTVRETLRAFVGAVRGDRPVPITIDEGVRALAIIDAAYRSAARGGALVSVER